MDQYITITSAKQNPCDFVSNFTDAINVSKGYEVAVTQIYHAPLYNITTENNTFRIYDDSLEENYDFSIPVGFYETTSDILRAIYDVSDEELFNMENRSKRPTITYKTTGEAMTMKLQKPFTFSVLNYEYKHYFGGDDKVYNPNSKLLAIFGYAIAGDISRLDINHAPLVSCIESGLLYSNIVANSMIDQKQSRLLGIFPIKSNAGYNHYEVKNPVYYPLSVHSFTDIAFELVDVRGRLMQMEHMYPTLDLETETFVRYVKYPTIITLHIRKAINRE